MEAKGAFSGNKACEERAALSRNYMLKNVAETAQSDLPMFSAASMLRTKPFAPSTKHMQSTTIFQ